MHVKSQHIICIRSRVIVPSKFVFTHRHTHTHTLTRTRTHACTHIRIHTHKHTHTQTHTRMHTQTRSAPIYAKDFSAAISYKQSRTLEQWRLSSISYRLMLTLPTRGVQITEALRKHLLCFDW